MTNVFVIRPFGKKEVGKKEDSTNRTLDFEQIHADLIEPALRDCGLQANTTKEIVDAGSIHYDMFALIVEADLVICDITIHNANVFYELGIRHALRRQHTILLKGEGIAESTPFDILSERHLLYDVTSPASARTRLMNMIQATLQSSRETDSPVFTYLSTLSEADPASIQALPTDFLEETERAQGAGAGAKGWLRLLEHDLKGRRFEWIGLKRVADAQRQLKDYEGARKTLEKIRERQKTDIFTNFALADVYERLSRIQGMKELIKSDQAIDRVLAQKTLAPDERAEALTLKGRNQKTRWRAVFGKHTTVEKRRQAAMNKELRASYEMYREAFNSDLNHFYSGLTALQMGTIFLALSDGEKQEWKTTFDSNQQAERYREEVLAEVERLKVVVDVSVQAHLKQKNEHLWDEISQADLFFLVQDDEARIIKHYQDTFSRMHQFAWDATKGQLQLFADLGIKTALANAIITAIDGQIMEPPPLTTQEPIHIILFAGHRVDELGRGIPRFPADREDQAKMLIRERLQEHHTFPRLMGMASAAPGADILFHELCDELGIASTICLPMPASIYARLVFQDLDNWRSRFLKLVSHKLVLELSDRDGLPNWLNGATTDMWERGNRWVLQMAAASQTSSTLIALWDGQKSGDRPGGTANMVQMTRDDGSVAIEIIDTAQLLR